MIRKKFYYNDNQSLIMYAVTPISTLSVPSFSVSSLILIPIVFFRIVQTINDKTNTKNELNF